MYEDQIFSKSVVYDQLWHWKKISGDSDLEQKYAEYLI